MGPATVMAVSRLFRQEPRAFCSTLSMGLKTWPMVLIGFSLLIRLQTLVLGQTQTTQ